MSDWMPDWLEHSAEWLKGLVWGEFDTDRPTSAILADMAISLVPGVVILTSSRDMIAVLLRIGRHLKAGRQPPVLDWIILVASALPLALIAITALAAGVGAIVGDELGAALRAVAVTLARIIAGEFKAGAEALAELVNTLRRLMRGDPVEWLKLVKFANYKAGVLKACRDMVRNMLAKIRWCRGKLAVVPGTGSIVRRLDDAVDALEHIARDMERGVGQAIDELDRALQKLLKEIPPKKVHPAHVGVPAPKPIVAPRKPARISSGIHAKPAVLANAAHDASGIARTASKGPRPSGGVRQAEEGAAKDIDESSQSARPSEATADVVHSPPEHPHADKGTNVHEPPLPPGAHEKTSDFKAERPGGLDMGNLSSEDRAVQKRMADAGWSKDKQEEVLNSGSDFHMEQGKAGDPMYGFSSEGYAKGSDSPYWMDEATYRDMQSQYQDPVTGEWNSAGVKNTLALPCYNQANAVYTGNLTQDQSMVVSTINPATETVTQIGQDGSTLNQFTRSMPGGGTQVAPAPGTVGNITEMTGP